MSTGILFSRILGAVRDIIIARYFGTSGVLEAFIVSFRLPNILRSLFGEGFSDSVATPVLAEYQKDKDRLILLGSHLFSVVMLLLILCTLLGVFLAKPLVIAIAPGFLKESSKLALAAAFTRITFLYLFFIGLVAVLSSLLYVLKKFAFDAFVSSLFNICLICGILFFKEYFHNYILVISACAAGIIQFVAIYFYTRSQGISLKVRFKGAFGDKDIMRMGKLFIPRAGASVVYHLNVFIDTIFSSLGWIVGKGALAAIYYSNRIIQFPLALIALSISRVALVDLSGFHKENNFDEFKKLFLFSFHNILFFIIPAACIFLVMSREIVEVLFMRGDFSEASLAITAPVFFFYSFGLFFFCGIRLLVNTFYSLKDTATPAKAAGVSLICNVFLSAILMFPLKIGGVALASSIAGMLNFFILYKKLVSKVGGIHWGTTWNEIIKLCVAGFITSGVMKAAWLILPYNKYAKICVGMTAGCLSFLFLCNLLNITQFTYFKKWILKKK